MSIPSQQIAEVRAFNRDYTRRIGVLSQGLLDSPYSLTEVRVMYEIAHRPGTTAAELAADLGLDRGYLSRILKRFESGQLLARAPAEEDARRRHLRLTPVGRRTFAPLERRSQEQVRTLLSGLDDSRRRGLLQAMSVIRGALAGAPAAEPVHTDGSPGADDSAQPQAVLRSHRPGELGWVVERHGALYAGEYGWDETFEGLVAGIVAGFVEKRDPARERCWIAERAGERLGCVFLVKDDNRTARLRLLLVEPQARGLGLGRRLVGECLAFARNAGYDRVILWTHANLEAARHLYEEAGFARVRSEPRHSFGHDVVSETWELALGGSLSATQRRQRAPGR